MRLWVISMNITIHDTRQPVKCLSVTTTTLGDGNQGKDSLATQVLEGVFMASQTCLGHSTHCLLLL